MRLRVYLHFALWCTLFAIFVWISAPIVGPAVMENRVGPIEADASIDTYLRALTGIERGSTKIPDLFRYLRKEGPLIIFVHGENPQSEFLGMMIGYVSWPREIRIIKVTDSTIEEKVGDIKSESVAGLVFCSVNPPAWLKKHVRLGSDVILVPVTEEAP
jgi:hypothetical protein